VKARRTSSKPEAATAIGVGILIVDDDPAKLVALRSVLEVLGENIVEARSGAEALRSLLKEDFAVILLDVRMPIMNGFETAELIRQRPASELTPIIFVTALDQAETDMGRGYELGAVDFVFSPVVPAILRAKVQVFVELYRSQHELKRYRKQLQSLVQERTTALTAINRELESLSRFLAEDVRGPLKTIDGLTKALLDGKDLDPSVRGHIIRVGKASRQIGELFDGMQLLFSITRGDMRREEIDLSGVSRQIVQQFRTKEPKRNVEVQVQDHLIVIGDTNMVEILMRNLISNAWNFTRNEKPAVIAIGKETVGGETRFFVRDNGVGFDMISAHRLFGAFQRLHSQSEFPGQGIGLASAQRIVNRHGGRIWAEGAVGEGATFYFVI
jgi:signal transduction histidine kinase